MDAYPDIPHVPAPWQLEGRGFVLVYRFPQEHVLSAGWLPEALKPRFIGGLGTLMLVDYTSSNAGPYGEALFVPGMFRMNGRRLFSITRILVSTMASVANGRRNWAIPKEPADFTFHDEGDVTEVSVRIDGSAVLDARLRAYGPRLPVNTAWLPYKATLGQPQDGQVLSIAPQARGQSRLATLQHIQCDASLFPDLAGFRPLVALALPHFHMVFPVSDVETLAPLGQQGADA
jgi:hypothetical protein